MRRLLNQGTLLEQAATMQSDLIQRRQRHQQPGPSPANVSNLGRVHPNNGLVQRAPSNNAGFLLSGSGHDGRQRGELAASWAPGNSTRHASSVAGNYANPPAAARTLAEGPWARGQSDPHSPGPAGAAALQGGRRFRRHGPLPRLGPSRPSTHLSTILKRGRRASTGSFAAVKRGPIPSRACRALSYDAKQRLSQPCRSGGLSPPRRSTQNRPSTGRRPASVLDARRAPSANRRLTPTVARHLGDGRRLQQGPRPSWTASEWPELRAGLLRARWCRARAASSMNTTSPNQTGGGGFARQQNRRCAGPRACDASPAIPPSRPQVGAPGAAGLGGFGARSAPTSRSANRHL